MKTLLLGLAQSAIRLAAGATLLMLILGALHREVQAVPAWGWLACLWATLIPLVVTRLMYFEIQDAREIKD